MIHMVNIITEIDVKLNKWQLQWKIIQKTN